MARLSLVLPWVAGLVGVACGPAVEEPEAGTSSHGASTHDPGTTVTGGSPLASTTSGSTSTTDAPEPEPEPEGPRLDLNPTPTIPACGLAWPPQCEPDWPAEQTIGDPIGGHGYHDSDLEITLGSSSVGDPEYLWSLHFTFPCDPSPPVRQSVEAEVTIMGYGGFEYTQIGRYTAVADLEWLNACPHFRLHAIEVDPAPLDRDSPPYQWPQFPPLGSFEVEVLGL